MADWPERLFCDTSFFFACLEGRDIHHARAAACLERSRERGTVFWTTWDIVSETVTLLRRKCGYRRAMDFIRDVIPVLHLVPCDDSVRREALEVFRRFARDKKLSFCDCLSFAILTTILDRMPAVTFDAHFRAMGLPVLP